MGIAEIAAFFKALPMLVEEIRQFRETVKSIQDAKTDMELALLKDRLNALSQKLRTETDKAELADIVRSLNGL